MTNYKLVPVELLVYASNMLRHHSVHSDSIEACLALDIQRLLAAPDVQGEPVAAQYRFRHPQRLAQNWSVWQPASISLDRPSWEIDSQGYEVEYRLLYDAPHPAEQQPASCVGCEGAPEPVNSPCAVCGQKSTPDVAGLVELLVEARDHVVSSTQLVRGGFIDEIDTAIEAHRKGVGS